VKTGVHVFYNLLNRLDSGACPGPDPGSAGMTKNGVFRLFYEGINFQRYIVTVSVITQ
jgi:hypothetical protein